MIRNMARYLQRLTGKRVIRSRGVSVSHDGRTGIGELRELAEEIRKWKWKDRKFLKRGKKLNMITSNDLDQDNKLYPNFLERRAKRKKKEKESKSFSWSKYDWR